MKIKVCGAGWYGCHIALSLIRDGHEVELHEIADRLFAGASGGNPARLHLGFHYPRSALTRAACQQHQAAFMAEYGHLTRAVPVNIYAVAAEESLVDFGTYKQVLGDEVQFVDIHNPYEFGLANVEGALLTGERHIVIDEARQFFTEALGDVVKLNVPREQSKSSVGDFDLVIDCTFCANDAQNIDRFEPCVTGILEGPSDKAVTIMDGPFPSLFPWDESRDLSSLTSAKHTPLARCATYEEARAVLDSVTVAQVDKVVRQMFDQIRHFYPGADAYKPVANKLGIRAMPRSGAAARLVDIVVDKPKKYMRVRAGKIDAILYAEEAVRNYLASSYRVPNKHRSRAQAIH